ncbi:MAG TPA: class I SAM-dependent methyltransferase [Candidatus Saccharimonadales bacterium]|jgi:FkbM family methyltransferase|nr:class I SAM-dependent methyltransferase [Candidatus Saccharimonadales bacterium]
MMKIVDKNQTVFDQPHYLRLIESRGALIRRLVPELKSVLGLNAALDAGCGIGFFAKILEDCGLQVDAFDGREENVVEARRRYPQITFSKGDIENPDINRLGSFDLVLCFGLLYHLENGLLAIRNLHALTGKGLLLESMCLPDSKPWMLLRNEPALEDQSLTDVAFYPSEGCIIKMLYRAGFTSVYRVNPLPDDDDFRDTPTHVRRRTVLFASHFPVTLQGLDPVAEPVETANPWEKRTSFPRMRRFSDKSLREKYSSVAQRFHRMFPKIPVPFRLPFGAWFLLENSDLDRELLWGSFENAELRFVEKFLAPGMNVLDIGAHHGLYSLLASKCIGSAGKVFAFEPSPRERRLLARNLRLNGSSSVHVESYALGSSHSKMDLFLVEGGEDGCNSLRPPDVSGTTKTVPVEVISLDEYLLNNGIGRIDFVKLDVEGGELEVLRGAENLIHGEWRPVFFVEVQDIRTRPWGYPAYEIVQFLYRAGYEWFVIHDNGKLAPADVHEQEYDANLVAIPRDRVQIVLDRLDK